MNCEARSNKDHCSCQIASTILGSTFKSDTYNSTSKKWCVNNLREYLSIGLGRNEVVYLFAAEIEEKPLSRAF